MPNGLWRCGVYSSWFWLVGAVALSLLPSLVKKSSAETSRW